MCICLQVPTEATGVKFPESGFKGSCEIPDVSAETPIQVLCNSSTWS